MAIPLRNSNCNQMFRYYKTHTFLILQSGQSINLFQFRWEVQLVNSERFLNQPTFATSPILRICMDMSNTRHRLATPLPTLLSGSLVSAHLNAGSELLYIKWGIVTTWRQAHPSISGQLRLNNKFQAFQIHTAGPCTPGPPHTLPLYIFKRVLYIDAICLDRKKRQSSKNNNSEKGRHLEKLRAF